MNNPDRLYELLPVVYRQRDEDHGSPLQALMRVITEQVDLLEKDIAQLYENWFIETCQDWVVPYIGDIIGHRPVHEAGEPGDVRTPQGALRNKILIPRRELANTIRYRRRKGTLALLELLGNDVAGWPARAVEFYALLGLAQGIDHYNPLRGRTADLRNGNALDLLTGPFEQIAHTVDVRRINSSRSIGRHNIPSVGLFVWRLKPYSVTHTPAYCVEEVSPNCYTFSVLGNDGRLYTKPEVEPDPTHIAGELNVPGPIRRRAFEERYRRADGTSVTRASADYYGPQKSLAVWAPGWLQPGEGLIPRQAVIPADLSDWGYRPPKDHIAVDPKLGRIVFPPGQLPQRGVWVSYHYVFSADMGGGEYTRRLWSPAEFTLYQVGDGKLPGIRHALELWEKENPQHAVIEIVTSGVYVEQINVELAAGQTLQIRAASRVRPVIRLLDWQTNLPDALSVRGRDGSRFTIDGLLITGRGMQVRSGRRLQEETEGGNTGGGDEIVTPKDVTKGEWRHANILVRAVDEPRPPREVMEVVIRHCTLVPGWAIECDCEPKRPAEPSLEISGVEGRVIIEKSIIGSIQVNQDEVLTDPIEISIADSILDATSEEREALGAPGGLFGHAVLTILRSTVHGQIQTHAIDLAENSIFNGLLRVARRGRGCVRFCYVPPGSRTPRRFNCQPDLVERDVREMVEGGEITQQEGNRRIERERLRLRPLFNSVRYGAPTYCQLAAMCAPEIVRGADDESEMGAFHDLFQPQRWANLRTRLDEHNPAGMDAGIIYAT